MWPKQESGCPQITCRGPFQHGLFCDSEPDPTAGDERTVAILRMCLRMGQCESLTHDWSHWRIQCISWLYVQFYTESESWKLVDSSRQEMICWLISLINAGIFILPSTGTWSLWHFHDALDQSQRLVSLKTAFPDKLWPRLSNLQFPSWTLACKGKLQADGSRVDQSDCSGLQPALEGRAGHNIVCWFFITMVGSRL